MFSINSRPHKLRAVLVVGYTGQDTGGLVGNYRVFGMSQEINKIFAIILESDPIIGKPNSLYYQ